MKLDRIHQISEIIASVAIVASLIFVGLQVNQNTHAINTQEDVAAWLPWLTVSQMIVPSTDFAYILHRAQSEGLEALDKGERIRVDQYFTAAFTVLEQNFRAWDRNPSMFDIRGVSIPLENYVKEKVGVDNKGSRQWWAKSKHMFQPSFEAWSDQVVNEHAPANSQE